MDIQTFPGFLTAEECAEFQTMIRDVDGVNFTDSGAFKNKKWVDLGLATRFFERLAALDAEKAVRYLRPNNLIMAGMYELGDSFGLHTDTGLFYDAARGEKSRWTLLIYLNDDFEGGETVFYDTHTWAETCRIVPRAGMALLFDIDLWHSGGALLRGKKHWIGCEIIGVLRAATPSP